jgi:hypothetical protein
MLDAVRAARGKVVTRNGRFTTLERANHLLRPVSIAVSAAGARALDVVHRHATSGTRTCRPASACSVAGAAGRAPDLVLGLRAPFADFEDAALDYRRTRLVPGSTGEVERAILFGEPSACREKLARMREELGLALPIVDLAGLDEAGAERALDALAPAAPARIS